MWIPDGQPAPDRMRSPTPVLHGRFTCHVKSVVLTKENLLDNKPMVEASTFEFHHEYPDIVRADLVIPAVTTATATGMALSRPTTWSKNEIQEAKTCLLEYLNKHPNDSSKDREEFLKSDHPPMIRTLFQDMFKMVDVGTFTCGLTDEVKQKLTEKPAIPHKKNPSLKLLLSLPPVWTLEDMTWRNTSYWTMFWSISINTPGFHWECSLRILYYLMSDQFFPNKTNKWCMDILKTDAAHRFSFGVNRYIQSKQRNDKELDLLVLLFCGFLNRCCRHV